MTLLSPSRVLRAAVQSGVAGPKWSETLNLPKSSFPARPTKAQLEQYRQRCADDLFAWQKANRPRTVKSDGGKEIANEFILHDGPPYANGAVHVGHALNKILKDIIIRWQLAKGKRIHYRPGWDCHGLPIELKALQAHKTQRNQSDSLKDAPEQEAKVADDSDMSALQIRGIAHDLAAQTIELQKESFRTWGVMGDWDTPYKTMDKSFEISQLGVFSDMVKAGLISRHRRPIYWSPSSRTALAEAELEYDDHHKCTAAFVKMPFTSLPQFLSNSPLIKLENFSALIWTTTPWTLPSNQAIAVHEDLEYTIISVNDQHNQNASRDQLVIAKERVDHVLSFLPEGTTITTVVDSILGSQLADGRTSCYNLFSASTSPLLKADFVTSTSGTGLVHCAPGHGMEDYQLCQQHNVGPVLAPVDDDGRFTSDAFSAGNHGALLHGLEVQHDGVKAVISILNEPSSFLPSEVHSSGSPLVLAAHEFTHKYPIDWRTKQPVIVRATAQWFADVSAIKQRALTAIDAVTFIPAGGKLRLSSFIDGRTQWCISRQRAWGVPIPALYHATTGEACITKTSIEHIISVINERGSDAWFSDPPDDRAWIHPSLEEDAWVRGKDTMDVWFDSGTTWTTLGGQTSDVYLEGTDQHRGWFQSSLLTLVSTQPPETTAIAPFKTLITHGFTLDAAGRKMSKSLGNVVSPEQIMDGSLLPPLKPRKQKGKGQAAATKSEMPAYDAMGPDALRLWVGSSDYTRDVSISTIVLQNTHQSLQKYRVTFKFLLGVLNDYVPPSSKTSREDFGRGFDFADQAVLHRLRRLCDSVHQAFEEFKFYKAVSEINTFVNNDLSAFYFEVIKDRMYTGSNAVRSKTQDILAIILQELVHMLGPITPHLIEEVWEHMPNAMKSTETGGDADMSLHPLRQIWRKTLEIGITETSADEIETNMDIFNTISAAVKAAQEAARNAGKLRSGLACSVVVQIAPDADPAVRALVAQWAGTSQLADLLVVSQANVNDHEPVEAAWKYSQEFGDSKVRGIAHVLPPDQHKCVRCWKFTAQEADVPCSRCSDVLDQKRISLH